jgi:hypothetical protein
MLDHSSEGVDVSTIGALCAAWGIPDAHVSAVEERVRAARLGVLRMTGYRPIEGGERRLIERVVGGAAADYASGVLERRCAP